MIKSYSDKPRQPKKPQGAQNGFSALVALLPYSFYEFIRGFILGSIGAIVASVAASILMTQIGLIPLVATNAPILFPPVVDLVGINHLK